MAEEADKSSATFIAAAENASDAVKFGLESADVFWSRNWKCNYKLICPMGGDWPGKNLVYENYLWH